MDNSKIYVIPNKFIYACVKKLNKQFVSSFSSENTKRINGGKQFVALDGTWVNPMLRDLRYNEGAVCVDLQVTFYHRLDSHKMWLSGEKQHRALSLVQPIMNDEELYIKCDCLLWCDFWGFEEYFPDVVLEAPVPVYVTCSRVSELLKKQLW